MSEHRIPLSVVIPCLNESQSIVSLLDSLQKVRECGGEVIVVDGGSTDDTLLLAQGGADQVISAPAGRAIQMNAGAKAARGQWLWFLHSDSQVTPLLLRRFLARLPDMSGRWGRFDVRLSGQRPMFRLVEFMMNARSRVSGIATGDQGLFVHSDLFQQVSGFPAIPLMEDVAMSKQLKKHSNPTFIADRLLTSSRRWEERGIFSTILLMWRLR
ncbi:MAG: glycosyltransferase family 2 protein, partial [Gammaproteobacteria bacterium]|nr:glycosyltransferase family 2 protein [Gammaproteobacteria bacterium]